MKEEKKNDKRITAKVKLVRYRFPKDTAPISGKFAIVVLKVEEIIEGEMKPEYYIDKDRIVTTGIMPIIEENMDYVFTGEYEVDKKWGAQFRCINIQLSYSMSTPEDQKKFLSFFMTPGQIEKLYESYENPMELLENNNLTELTKIKGVGPVTAQRLCSRYNENKNNSRAYVELKKLGLTKKAIDKIVLQLGSVDIAVDTIMSNPYSLIKLVRGYGWEKADKIALAQGFGHGCKERCIAYTLYRLQKIANENGNSKVDIDELIDDVYKMCSPAQRKEITSWIKSEMISESDFEEKYQEGLKSGKMPQLPQFFYSKENRSVGLTQIRLLEKKVANRLKVLNEAKINCIFESDTTKNIIEEVEKEQGYEYTHEQKKAMSNILASNVNIIIGSAGCVDCDTEFFNGREWKRIADYNTEDQVLTYNPDGTSELVTPLNYIKKPCEQLWLTQTKYGIDMCVCDEHNVYYKTSKNNLYHKTFAEVKANHENSIGGFSGRFITSFIGGGAGINLSDAEIKVMLAVICDGSFANHSDNTRYCRFRIKKDRKKIELRKILTEANLKWKEVKHEKTNYSDFYAYVPRKEKIFTPEFWYNCSHQQLQLICDNILQWDGSVTNNRMRFSTSIKTNADFVQYAFSSCGYRAIISKNDRMGQKYISCNKLYTRKSIDYNVYITKRVLVSMGGFYRGNPNKTAIIPYKTLDGYKYCFTVPSHMWIMRRNGKIMVTGNCGKSTTMKPLVRIFEQYGLRVGQCALSGRAASLLTEYTGLEGKTIHRLLGWLPEMECFKYSSTNLLPYDVIILDETSMVGEELFLSLIESIKPGAKLIMLGDTKQLPPISVGNILSDCISSGYINVNRLTIIQRQAARSGIISQSVRICNGESIVKKDFTGEEVRGELQDFKLICNSDSALVHRKAVEEFKRLHYSCGVPVDDIQIVVPTRSRGINSCRSFNEEIQNIVNRDTKKAVTEDIYDNGIRYTVTYRPGDRIIIIKNNYQARKTDGGQTAIFNGNMGHIIDINEQSMIVEVNKENIIIPRDDWGSISHSYAISCHKCQGSQALYVIVVLDKGAYTLLTREWLYTAVTRARKYCVLAGQPAAISTATRYSDIKIKKTWLKDDLNKLYREKIDAEGGPIPLN